MMEDGGTFEGTCRHFNTKNVMLSPLGVAGGNEVEVGSKQESSTSDGGWQLAGLRDISGAWFIYSDIFLVKQS